MEALYKQVWIERCAKRLAELQPLLRPRLASLVASELWQEVRGHVPPEEWAEIEVGAWTKKSLQRAVPPKF